MQNEPTSIELLEIVAETLRDEVVPALEGSAQHHARVAANLVAIVRRELASAPDDARVEARLLGERVEVPDDASDARRARAARAELVRALRAGLADDPEAHRAVWSDLVEIARRDLAVAKPGHADWEGD